MKKLLKGVAGVFCALVLLGACGAMFDNNEIESKQEDTISYEEWKEQQEKEDAKIEEEAEKTIDYIEQRTEELKEEQQKEEPKVEVKDEVKEEPKNEVTISQKNAVKQAQNYLKFMAFSRTGLINQLEFEGYSTEDATYAVDNITVDWNEQCAKKAKDYLDFMAFSRDGLHDQLEFEGFTEEQIQYGLQAVGY